MSRVWVCQHEYLDPDIAKAPRCIHCGEHAAITFLKQIFCRHRSRTRTHIMTVEQGISIRLTLGQCNRCGRFFRSE